MAMDVNIIKERIIEALPDAKVKVENPNNDGQHYWAEVCSESFRGKSRIQQHQLVYNALQGSVGVALHALALKTSLPDE